MKKLTYILSGLALVLLFFVSCEEYYNPDMDVVSPILVIESRVTNDPNHNYVKLTKSLGFYSTDQAEKIEGAKVELIESKGSSLTGIESSTGYFTFSNTPITGETYYLRITWGNDIYESEKVVMPPLPTIDTLYTKHTISKSYKNDIYGSPVLVETPGREVCVDVTVTPQLKYYLFDCRTISQWVLGKEFGWTSKYDKVFNIITSKEFSLSDKIIEHPLSFLEYDAHVFLGDVNITPLGWLIIVEQYGIQKESYDFHEMLNKQLTAEGSLFDPVLTQVYGNIHCTNDSSKVVVGFFDLNSYRQYRYLLRVGMEINGETYAIQKRVNRYPYIPPDGHLEYRPSFLEYY